MLTFGVCKAESALVVSAGHGLSLMLPADLCDYC